MQPAERCCCGVWPAWSLPRGVQLISMYAVIFGTCSLIQLVAEMWPEEHSVQKERGSSAHQEHSDGGVMPPLPESVIMMDRLQEVVNSFALLAGLKGLLGLMLREHLQAARQLSFLVSYLTAKAFFTIAVAIVKVVEACEILRRVQLRERSHQEHYKPLSCRTLRIIEVLEYMFVLVVLLYCAYITWSLAERMRTGSVHLGFFSDLQYELVESRGNFEASHWLMTNSGGSAQDYALNPRDRSAAPVPFSGAPHTLADQAPQQCSMETFQGTPHRLE
mmetsp:Transcript_35705/g.83584  ORF Transcript_35705/g.83584 Transcript_35705/m.83584 type:complete len:276 (+) Transcript_35705:109-936(+)